MKTSLVKIPLACPACGKDNLFVPAELLDGHEAACAHCDARLLVVEQEWDELHGRHHWRLVEDRQAGIDEQC